MKMIEHYNEMKLEKGEKGPLAAENLAQRVSSSEGRSLAMKQIDFYTNVIRSEESCVAYLRQKKLLPGGEGEGSGFCIREKDGVVCGGQLKDYMRKNRNGTYSKTLRCCKRGCQTYVSIRRNNRFFTYTDLNGRCSSSLSMCQIMELVWMWSHCYPTNLVIQLTGRTRSTIFAWYNLCREVCDLMFQLRTPMGGRGEVVQIDEHLYTDKTTKSPSTGTHTSKTNQEMTEGISQEEAGPWVLGIYWRHPSKILETRFFFSERRDEKYILSIVEKEVLTGTTLHTNKWNGYKKLSEMGFIHETPRTSRLMDDGDPGQLQRKRGGKSRPFLATTATAAKAKSLNALNLQLREEWWRSYNPKDTFNAFLGDMKRVYCNDDYDESLISLLHPTV